MSDEDIKRYFENAESEREKAVMRKGLMDALEDSYKDYAENYFESMGLGRYLSTFLRAGGLVTDLLGSYLFWVGGGAGFGFKGLGVVGKSIADVIDARGFRRYAGADKGIERIKDKAEIVGEGLLERIAAYFPVGVGEITDFLRGKRKFDEKVIKRAVYRAKEDFKERFAAYKEGREREPRIIELERFRNPDYILEERVEKKAA